MTHQHNHQLGMLLHQGGRTAAAHSQAQSPAWNAPSPYDESFFEQDIDDDMDEDASEWDIMLYSCILINCLSVIIFRYE